MRRHADSRPRELSLLKVWKHACVAYFERLTDLEVERLVADVFSREWSTHVETFRRGPDGGIDFRATGPIKALQLAPSETVIGQVKHYPRATASRLRGAFGSEGRRPIAGTADRYIAVTTAGLSPKTKQQIADLVPACRGPQDVYGEDDLTSLIARHPGVETQFVNLWIQSPMALRRELNARQLRQQSLFKKRLTQRLPYLVPTIQLDVARSIFEREGALIIAGAPGSGKTSLSLLLAAEAVRDGYEVLVVSEKLGDVEAMLGGTDGKKLIYFDDFLGSSLRTAFLGRKNEDTAIAELLHEASQPDGPRVLMTTREYILSAARIQHERLNDPRIDLDRLVLAPNGMTATERAEVLRRHLYFSNMCSDYLDQPSHPADWAPCIRHHGFNPRLVEFFVSARDRDRRGGATAGTVAEFATALADSFEDPTSLWAHAYESQLHAVQRSILVTLATLPSFAPSIDDLWFLTKDRFRAECGKKLSRQQVEESLRIMLGDFVDLVQVKSRSPITNFANASIASYVWMRIADTPNGIMSVLRECELFEQTEVLGRLVWDRLYAEQAASNAGRSAEGEVFRELRWGPLTASEGRELAGTLGTAAARTFAVGRFSNHPSIAGTSQHWKRLRAPMINRFMTILEALEAAYMTLTAEEMSMVVKRLEASLRNGEGDPEDLLELLQMISKDDSAFQHLTAGVLAASDKVFFTFLDDPEDLSWAAQFAELSQESAHFAAASAGLDAWAARIVAEEMTTGEDTSVELDRLRSDLKVARGVAKTLGMESPTLRKAFSTLTARIRDLRAIQDKRRVGPEGDVVTRGVRHAMAPARAPAIVVTNNDAIEAAAAVLVPRQLADQSS